VVVDVARFALEGEAVEGNEEALYSAVLCSPKGILEMLWAEAGGSCCRCRGKVPDHSVERPEPVSAALQVMPLVLRGRDVGARAIGRWRCSWVEGLKFVEDGGVFGVMASFGQEDVDGFSRGVLFHEGADCADGALVQWGGWAACGLREPCRSPTGESGFCPLGFVLGQFCPCLGRCKGLKLIAAAGDVGSQVTAVCFPCSGGGEQTPSGKKEESLKCFP
jgi:hypothetical protein